jgi:Beta-propeller repeat
MRKRYADLLRIVIILVSTFTIEYNLKAQPAWQWGTRIAGNNTDGFQSVDIDSLGNIYTLSYSNSSSYNIGTSTYSGPQAFILTKLTPTGSVIWSQTIGTVLDTNVSALSVSPVRLRILADGTIRIMGVFMADSVRFGNTTIINPFATSATFSTGCMFLLGVDNSGNVMWANASYSDGSLYPLDFDTDNAGNVYAMVATSCDTALFATDTIIGQNYSNVAMKFDALGNEEWLDTMGRWSGAVHVVDVNSIYFTAGFAGIRKYNAAGQATQFANYSHISIKPSGLSSDQFGNIYVTGTFVLSTATFGTFVINNASNSQEIFVVKYSASGQVQWAHSCAGNGSDAAIGIQTDNMGNSIVVGFFEGGTNTFTAGAFTVTNVGNRNIIVMYWDNQGVVYWLQNSQYGDMNGTSPSDFCVTPFGDVLISGHYGKISSIDFGSINLVLTTNGFTDGFLVSLGNQTSLAPTPAINFPMLYPNPTSGIVRFEGLDSPNYNLVVRDLSGRKVYESTVTEGQDIELRLSPGVYIAEMSPVEGSSGFSQLIEITQ